jgi:hypothetical protein
MRGFIKDANFDESQTADSDKRILDNLAGAGISSDISLFSNNLRNVSIVSANDYNFVNSTFVLTNEYMLPFANNTIVIYDSSRYIVKNSNLTNSFQLFVEDNLNTPFIPLAPFKDITRNDSVLFENITQLNPQRLSTKTNSTSAAESGIESYNPYTYYRINENINAIVQSTEIFEYKKNSAIMTDRSNTIDTPLTVNGTIVITNTEFNGNPKTDNLDIDNDPGMFISNGSSKIRAFSNRSQPWEKVAATSTIPANLATTASEINVNNLIMTNPTITGLTVTSLLTTETIDTSLKNVNYSIPVVINNETYYLLCKKVI